MSNLIPPTPGRVVWYYPSQQEIDAKSITIIDQGQPMAATVAFVWHDRMVNLSVVDHAGAQFRRTSVRLLQEDDPAPHSSEGPYASWMPYQKALHEKVSDAGHPKGRFVQPARKWIKVDGGYAFEYRDALTGAIQATLPVSLSSAMMPASSVPTNSLLP